MALEMKNPGDEHTCAFAEAHNPATLEPRGRRCGKPATREIHWKDGRVSPACPVHGLQALDEDARSLVLRITRPGSEAEWKTTG